jgi:hypothetical protein
MSKKIGFKIRHTRKKIGQNNHVYAGGAAVLFVFEKGPVFFDLVEKFPSFWALFKSA